MLLKTSLKCGMQSNASILESQMSYSQNSTDIKTLMNESDLCVPVYESVFSSVSPSEARASGDLQTFMIIGVVG